jgi:uncharacterized protein (DUF1786 family)
VLKQARKIVANIGNFHTLAFHLVSDEIAGVFEHHTGLLNSAKLDRLLVKLAEGTISNEDVYVDSGHGAFTQHDDRFLPEDSRFHVAVTGPRRKLMAESVLKPYYATPFGDMMLSGCFGLLASTAELLPNLNEPIVSSMKGYGGSGTPPWELSS